MPSLARSSLPVVTLLLLSPLTAVAAPNPHTPRHASSRGVPLSSRDSHYRNLDGDDRSPWEPPRNGQVYDDRSSLKALTVTEERRRRGVAPPFLNGVILVAMANVAINSLRPDSSIAWETRVPRIMWELFIAFCVTTIKATHENSSLSYLLLSLILGTTALVDIFFWAPLFALWAGIDKEDCSGGWFTGRKYTCVPNPNKGYGRLFVTFQALYGGAFYLNCAIAAWGEYTAQRDQKKVNQQARLFEHYLHSR